jgi:sirohydrochlorin ferrochelatase
VTPTLVACSHGTANATGSAAISRLVDGVRRSVAGPVVEAFVDVHGPYVDEVVAAHDGDVVVVPLLLAAGYHVRVDVTRAVEGRPGAELSSALGPDERITALLLDRLAQAGLRDEDVVVLAAAGSSDDAAEASVRAAASDLAAALGRPVGLAYGAARGPRVGCAVTRSRLTEPGRRVVLVSYLLATGHFHRRVLAAGADVVTAPLLDDGEPDPRLVDLVCDRFSLTAAAGAATVAGCRQS